MNRLVFLDETWVTSNMTPGCGWGPTDQRVVEAVPHGHWKTITFVAALPAAGLFAPVVVDGAMNWALFRAYVEQHLAPALRPGDIVVMDNLPSHQVARVAAAIERAGATPAHLPPYSPDLNPIEQVFAKAKAEIRKRKPRTIAGTEHLCGEALDWFPAGECQNDIPHAGYGSQGSD
ncbi:IS630 family transposase [Limnoglobus roseus]|uniref:IS630 family transposase n=1 Tax=Limnoglobus roseus TaxID=2598579 RepID=A0A5C1ASS5_9BACT|nr:IS630 family transposase [Limnoglobus roseus]QEL20622.1 IS630 family transposase [Limnoglobus roseus]